MDSPRFEHLAELEKPEDEVREAQIMLAEAHDVNQRASLLGVMHVAYCKLGRQKEAQQMLEEMKQLDISDLGVRLNAEFCEPAFLINQGRYEEGLTAFAAMLDRHREAFKTPEHRYLFEDIQCRRALTLFGLSRFKDALPILREVVTFPFDELGDEQQIHFALGVCLDDSDDPEAAKQELIRVVGFGIKNDLEEQALYRLAILHYKSGALAQAKQQLETILRDFPNPSSSVSRRQVYQGLSQVFRDLGDKASEKLYADMAKKAI
jgi:tetratricopeptide (TPR) repeat protein